jgi:hypothetical protein
MQNGLFLNSAVAGRQNFVTGDETNRAYAETSLHFGFQNCEFALLIQQLRISPMLVSIEKKT